MTTISPTTGPGEGFLLQYDFPFATDSIPPLNTRLLEPKKYQEPGGPKDYDQQPQAKPTENKPTQKQPDNGEPYKDWWQKG